MPPQAGVGGCTPAPMKLSPASTRMMPAADSDASTMMGATTLGSRCRSMIRLGPAPRARAASMYTLCLICSTTPRVSRA